VDTSNYVPAPEFVNDTTSGHKLQYFTIYSAKPGDGGQSHYIDFSVDIMDSRTNSRVGGVTFHQNACFLQVRVSYIEQQLRSTDMHGRHACCGDSIMVLDIGRLADSNFSQRASMPSHDLLLTPLPRLLIPQGGDLTVTIQPNELGEIQLVSEQRGAIYGSIGEDASAAWIGVSLKWLKAPETCAKTTTYSWDEAYNREGAGKCSSSCQCAGSRVSD
jgi:hypothetical protein